MKTLLDPSNTRTWPASVGSALSSEPEVLTEAEPSSLDLESLVSRTVESLEKTSALAENVIDVPTIKDIWRHPSAHPLVLILLLTDKYGEDYLDWHPDVLRLTLDRDGIAMSNKVWNKILAGRVILHSPSPWRQWEVFHWITRALNGETPNFLYLEQPELGHVAVGYDIMRVVDPKRTTTHEIDKFTAAIFKHEGLPLAPAPLSFAQRELENRQIECSHCGALHRDDNDITCITCGKANTLKPVPYEFADLRDSVAELFEARKKMLLSKALDGLPDNAAGNAVYRLLVEWDLLKTAKTQLVKQLQMIGGT